MIWPRSLTKGKDTPNVGYRVSCEGVAMGNSKLWYISYLEIQESLKVKYIYVDDY